MHCLHVLTLAYSSFPLQLIPWITLTGMATWGVGAVMITASIVISTLINVCISERWRNKLHA